jgi:hypothetical protein
MLITVSITVELPIDNSGLKAAIRDEKPADSMMAAKSFSVRIFPFLPVP